MFCIGPISVGVIQMLFGLLFVLISHSTSDKAGGLFLWTAQSGLMLVPPKRWRFHQYSSNWSISIIFFLLVANVIPYHFLIFANCWDMIPSRPKFLPRIVQRWMPLLSLPQALPKTERANVIQRSRVRHFTSEFSLFFCVIDWFVCILALFLSFLCSDTLFALLSWYVIFQLLR